MYKNRLVRKAKNLAYDFHHPFVGTEHLIAICLEEDDELEQTLSISYDSYMNEFFKEIEEGKSRNGNPSLTPKAQMLLDSVNEPFNTKEFVLKALEDKENMGYKILSNLNLDKEALIEYVEKGIPSILLKNDCLINLNKKVRQNDIHIFNAKEKTDELINNLFKVRKPNIMLIGKAGCGKTALIEGLAERINNDNVPNFMKNKLILEMTVSNAVAGTRYRGDFEEKIKDIFKAVEKCPNVILFIDEIHTMMNAGGAEGAISMGNILKPYLARGEISLIGATTNDEYNKYIAKDKAITRRFTIMNVDTPDDEAIRAILKGWAPQFEEHYNINIEDNTIREIIAKCKKQKDKASPDKELDALEDWCLKHCNWRGVEWKELVSNK